MTQLFSSLSFFLTRKMVAYLVLQNFCRMTRYLTAKDPSLQLEHFCKNSITAIPTLYINPAKDTLSDINHQLDAEKQPYFVYFSTSKLFPGVPNLHLECNLRAQS